MFVWYIFFYVYRNQIINKLIRFSNIIGFVNRFKEHIGMEYAWRLRQQYNSIQSKMETIRSNKYNSSDAIDKAMPSLIS